MLRPKSQSTLRNTVDVSYTQILKQDLIFPVKRICLASMQISFVLVINSVHTKEFLKRVSLWFMISKYLTYGLFYGLIHTDSG